MKHTVVGMAGHIDHGKTALIRALTGIQTDQLPQEQERGITIDLGFAYWKPDVTIIDVPGHEKFIRNMVAGVSTVDLFLLVIAADDGIMPQTREHLEILRFFNVKNGIVVLNKIDLVEPDWLELVSAEVKDFLDESGIPEIPIIPVSTITNSGIDQLRSQLEERIASISSVVNSKPFRLNIDRSFDAKGFGNIITGTVLSGEIKLDQSLVALPEGFQLKVRGLEVHQESVKTVTAGQRAAVNLSSSSKIKLKRGQVLVEPDMLQPAQTLLAQINTTSLFKFKIKRLSEVRVHIGTAEVKGILNWFEDDSTLANQKVYSAQIKLLEPVVAAPGDPILLRSFSPVTTIAGGKVLQIDHPKLSRNTEIWENYFSVLNNSNLADKVRLFFEYTGYKLYSVQDLGSLFFEELPELEKVVQKLKKQKVLNEVNHNKKIEYLYVKNADFLLDRVSEQLEQLQKNQKILRGLLLNEIPALVPSNKAKDAYWAYVLRKGVSSNKISYDGLHYYGKSWKSQQDENDLELKMIDLFSRAKFIPPDIPELMSTLQLSKNEISQLIQKNIRENNLVSISGQFYLSRSVFEDLVSFLKVSFSEQDELDVAQVREFTQSTRKFIIPLLEYCDREDLTIRDGDKRIRGKNM